MKVVLPTPNPPLITIFTDEGIRPAVAGVRTSECPYKVPDPLDGCGGQFRGVAHRDMAGRREIADNDFRDTDRHVQCGADLGDGVGSLTQPHHGALLELQWRGKGGGRSLHQGLDAQPVQQRCGAPCGDDERADEAVGVLILGDCFVGTIPRLVRCEPADEPIHRDHPRIRQPRPVWISHLRNVSRNSEIRTGSSSAPARSASTAIS